MVPASPPLAGVDVAGVEIIGGSGRRATDADCKLIVDRSVELQMKEMSESDARAIAAEHRAEYAVKLKSERRSDTGGNSGDGHWQFSMRVLCLLPALRDWL